MRDEMSDDGDSDSCSSGKAGYRDENERTCWGLRPFLRRRTWESNPSGHRGGWSSALMWTSWVWGLREHVSGEAIEELAKINWNSERREKKEASSECWRIPTLRGREEREGPTPTPKKRKPARDGQKTWCHRSQEQTFQVGERSTVLKAADSLRKATQSLWRSTAQRWLTSLGATCWGRCHCGGEVWTGEGWGGERLRAHR